MTLCGKGKLGRSPWSAKAGSTKYPIERFARGGLIRIGQGIEATGTSFGDYSGLERKRRHEVTPVQGTSFPATGCQSSACSRTVLEFLRNPQRHHRGRDDL